jgi:hypothetical protein
MVEAQISMKIQVKPNLASFLNRIPGDFSLHTVRTMTKNFSLQVTLTKTFGFKTLKTHASSFTTTTTTTNSSSSSILSAVRGFTCSSTFNLENFGGSCDPKYDLFGVGTLKRNL